MHREVTVRSFSLAVDEPPALGGTDKAPNPVELAKLKETVDAHCPVLDLLSNPTPVRLSLARS